MTEKEILDFQERTGQQVFYLMLVGKFLHAYGNGAFALSRATGYRVVRKHRREGSVLVCGFPMDRIDTVRQRIRDAGGDIEQLEGSTFRFRGLDGTPDERMVSEQAPKAAAKGSTAQSTAAPAAPATAGGWIEAEVRAFNLSMSTPMQAMMFVESLQRRLMKQDTAEKVQGAGSNDSAPGIACESPSGQGLAE